MQVIKMKKIILVDGNNLEKLKSETTELVKQYRDDADVQIRTLCGEALSLAEKLDSDVRVLSNSVESAVSKQEEKINETLDVEITRLNSSIQETLSKIEDESKAKIDSVESGVNVATEKLVSQTKESLQTTKAEIFTTISEAENQAKTSIESLKSGFATNISDLRSEDYYRESILKCVAEGYINGVSSNLVNPKGNATREEVAVILCRVFNIDSKYTGNTNFKDDNNISSWARSSVYFLSKLGYLNGTPDGKVNPKANITRAELITLLNNFFKHDNTIL